MRIFYARSSTADQKSGLAGQIERAIPVARRLDALPGSGRSPT